MYSTCAPTPTSNSAEGTRTWRPPRPWATRSPRSSAPSWAGDLAPPFSGGEGAGDGRSPDHRYLQLLPHAGRNEPRARTNHRAFLGTRGASERGPHRRLDTDRRASNASRRLRRIVDGVAVVAARDASGGWAG